MKRLNDIPYQVRDQIRDHLSKQKGDFIVPADFFCGAISMIDLSKINLIDDPDSANHESSMMIVMFLRHLSTKLMSNKNLVVWHRDNISNAIETAWNRSLTKLTQMAFIQGKLF